MRKKKLNVIVLYKKGLTLITFQKKTKKYNPKWPEIPDHPYRTLIVGSSGSTKTNALLNLIDNEPDIDKIYYMLKIHMKQNINY